MMVLRQRMMRIGIGDGSFFIVSGFNDVLQPRDDEAQLSRKIWSMFMMVAYFFLNLAFCWLNIEK